MSVKTSVLDLLPYTLKRPTRQSCCTLRARANFRSFSVGAGRSAASKKLDLASPSNKYISIQPGNNTSLEGVPSNDLEVYPDFMTSHEQEILLSAALKKLDSMASREERKKRREWNRANKDKLQTEIRGFAPDEVYAFEQKHFDGVIAGYRESTLFEWPPFGTSEHNATLAATLRRAYSLMLDENTLHLDNPLQTPAKLLSHLLHLSSTGYILPHVDNIEASAGTILGLCLGSERHLVLTSTEAGCEEHKIRVRLPPGCAYIQRGQIRYKWKHEIPAADTSNQIQVGQRLSVMIRDRLT